MDREIENEQFREHLSYMKQLQKDDEAHLVHITKRAAEVSTLMDTTTDAIARGQLKVEQKMNELDQVDTRARIEVYRVDIADLEA